MKQLSNETLQGIIIGLFLIIFFSAKIKVLKAVIYNHFWHSQISGDDLDEEGFDINQEAPFYLE